MIDLTEQQLHLVQRILATHLPNIPYGYLAQELKERQSDFLILTLH